jgi:hypothetical protein
MMIKYCPCGAEEMASSYAMEGALKLQNITGTKI